MFEVVFWIGYKIQYRKYSAIADMLKVIEILKSSGLDYKVYHDKRLLNV